MAADPLADVIVQVIRSIPRGRVATYGQVARIAGEPRASRQVVWVLRSRSDTDKLPWHRVLGASGAISLPGEGGREQRHLLEAEGVGFDEEGRVPFDIYQWKK